MFSKEDDRLTKITIWQRLDFNTVQQRLKRITEQLDSVLSQSYPIERADCINPQDYVKLREFMEANQLTESQAIAMIVNAFFRDTSEALSNPSSSPDELIKRIVALEQQVAELTGKLPS